MPIRRLELFEDEWRLLVDLIAGFKLSHYHPVRLAEAMRGLLRNGLVEEVPNGTRVTSFGYRVRADQPGYVSGGPRVWYGVMESDEPTQARSAESDADPPA